MVKNVDMRAEVGIMTRNILIQGEVSKKQSNGGHVKVNWSLLYSFYQYNKSKSFQNQPCIQNSNVISFWVSRFLASYKSFMKFMYLFMQLLVCEMSVICKNVIIIILLNLQFLKEFKSVRVEGVELTAMGQPLSLGKYCLIESRIAYMVDSIY